MTKKEFNALRTTMYAEWITTPDGQAFSKAPYDCCKCWRITEGERRAMLVTYHDSQINRVTLNNHGFTEEADIRLLFVADKKTKCITPAQWEV